MKQSRQPTEPWDFVTTRIPKALQRALKLQCLRIDMPIMEFTAAAIVEKLDREERRERRTRRSQRR